MKDRRSLSSVSPTGDDHSSPPIDKAGFYSTVQQSEDDAEVSHVATHVIAAPSTRSRLSGFGWWWEVFATALAVASTAAIIAVLIAVRRKASRLLEIASLTEHSGFSLLYDRKVSNYWCPSPRASASSNGATLNHRGPSARYRYSTMQVGDRGVRC